MTRAFVGQQRPGGLDPEALLAIRWSQTEREVARGAVVLYRGFGTVDLGRIARFWSDAPWEALDRALAIYRGIRDGRS